MLVFRMDEQNFGEGERDGARIVTGQGLKVDFDEFAPDSQTLGLWHLHDGACQTEGTGLADASGAGHDLTNHGAESVEAGYRFAGAGQYLQGAFAGQLARSALTLECWVRAWATAAGTVGALGEYAATNPIFLLRALRHATPASSYILGTYWDGTSYNAQWTGAAADAVLVGPASWHVAVVMANGSPLRLFVNGVLVAASAANVAQNASAGDFALRLGQRVTGQYPAACILDEVRLSAAARYAANFPVARYGEGRRAAARGPGLEVMAGAIP